MGNQNRRPSPRSQNLQFHRVPRDSRGTSSSEVVPFSPTQSLAPVKFQPFLSEQECVGRVTPEVGEQSNARSLAQFLFLTLNHFWNF